MTAGSPPSQVLVTDPLHQDALEALREGCEVTVREVSAGELPGLIGAFDALIVRSRTKVPRDVLVRGGKLRVVGRAGVGVDNIDVQAATERGIAVVNAPAGSSQSVAELAVSLMLSLARHIPEAHQTTKAGRWEKGRLRGHELAGKVLGVVGAGRIGRLVVRICRGFDMEALAYDPYLNSEVARDAGLRLTTLEEVLERGDFVSIHAASTEETRHMISRSHLERMKPTAYLINAARGAIVDEKALVLALRDGHIAGAGLDVYEREPPAGSPLLALENVVLTPHIGAATEEAQRRIGLLTVDQVRKALAGEELEHLVNPQVLSV